MSRQRRPRARRVLGLLRGAAGLVPGSGGRAAAGLLDVVLGALDAGADVEELEKRVRELAAERSTRAPDLAAIFREPDGR